MDMLQPVVNLLTPSDIIQCHRIRSPLLKRMIWCCLALSTYNKLFLVGLTSSHLVQYWNKCHIIIMLSNILFVNFELWWCYVKRAIIWIKPHDSLSHVFMTSNKLLNIYDSQWEHQWPRLLIWFNFTLTLIQCTLTGPVYTGMPLECHWLTQCTLGYHWATQPILAGYTGTPLEKLSWNRPTLRCHWRN